MEVICGLYCALTVVDDAVVSFAGFNALQFVGALHGYFQEDYALVIGMVATLVTCGSITPLAARRLGRRVWPCRQDFRSR